MTGPYSAGGLWLLDGKGRRVALCYTVPTAAELAEELNKAAIATSRPDPVGAAGECLLCNADQGEMHDKTCPYHPSNRTKA